MSSDHHEDYLAEEVGIDYADGLISRREALRRLGMMGIQAVAASSILAACARDRQPTEAAASPTQTDSPAAAVDPNQGAVPAEEIAFEGPSGTLIAAYAAADDPRGAVLVIHENRGLKDHFRQVAGRLARDGYSALALDLLSEEGGTASLADDAAAMAALREASSERFIADMRAGLDELERRVPEAGLAIWGFCFGGGQVWSLLHAGEPRLAAAAPFYGTPPDNPDFSGSQAAVLAVYGALDDRVTSTRPQAETALMDADLEYRILEYEGADHAFFNDTGQRYNPQAATEVYGELLDWFGEHLTT